MDQPEIKLIHFDSSYYIPPYVPLTQIHPSDNDNQSNRVDFDHIRRVFRETNRDELIKFVKSSPASCCVCNIPLANMKHLLSHVFSQPHMDKYIKHGEAIRGNELAFWQRLLKLFPKHRSLSQEHQQKQLKLMSTPLDLHSRRTHLTVQVSSASEHDTALCHFVSACFSQSLRVVISMNDKKEAGRVNALLLSKFPNAKSNGDVGRKGREHLAIGLICIEDANDPDLKGSSMVYARPPGVDGTTPSAEFCAFTLLSCDVLSSLMLIKGSEEKAAFREFERKFMHSQESPLLPIYDLSALRILEEMAKLNAEGKSTVPLSIDSVPVDPQEITENPSLDSVCAAFKAIDHKDPGSCFRFIALCDAFTENVDKEIEERKKNAMARSETMDKATSGPEKNRDSPFTLQQLEERSRMVGEMCQQMKLILKAAEKKSVPSKEDTVSRDQSKKTNQTNKPATITVSADSSVHELIVTVKREPSKESTATTVARNQAKNNNQMVVVRRGRRYYGEVKMSDPDPEESIYDIPTTDDYEGKEWSNFTPFDEETGKAVEEMIRRMLESC